MATTTSAVQITASLTCSLLSQPPIGMSAIHNLSFTDGDAASDTYVSCATGGGTALNADIGGGGFLLVVNPSTNANNITLKVSATTLGTLVPGAFALLPLDSGTVYTGISDTAAQNAGVTVIECDQNA